MGTPGEAPPARSTGTARPCRARSAAASGAERPRPPWKSPEGGGSPRRGGGGGGGGGGSEGRSQGKTGAGRARSGARERPERAGGQPDTPAANAGPATPPRRHRASLSRWNSASRQTSSSPPPPPPPPAATTSGVTAGPPAECPRMVRAAPAGSRERRR
ncbi:protein FAM117B-like [Pyrgilauda ruficollis]|uniref:protein FAM117B-like n=1 Tax=Pyrgilauda ruficollis TaxID=221976 RepID=UPI001B88410A|nr:protein FAM117B-like [Pyrgilauda ruficollis]